MIDPEVLAAMQADWNSRAGEDAHYYVAFGRKDQDEQEFLSTAANVVPSLEAEFARFAPAEGPRARRFLEIGCGPGRLMWFLSRHCGEIHGVDVSGRMIELARQRLSAIPHAHVHHTSGADLAPFASASFDFVYSYAVLQHIPDRGVVFSYLSEAVRVLKPGGILRIQLNGLAPFGRPTTWSGVSILAGELREFCLGTPVELLALEGVGTQYQWITCRRRESGWRETAAGSGSAIAVRSINNTHTSESAVPAGGRFAIASFWIAGLPRGCDLLNLTIELDGLPARLTYAGEAKWDGVRQVNAVLPEGLRTGVVPVRVSCLGARGESWLRVIPAGPSLPRLSSVADGVHLVLQNRTESRTLKAIVDEVTHPGELELTFGGRPVGHYDFFCIDPFEQRFEVNFRVPETTGPGRFRLEVRERGRLAGAETVEVA